MGLGRLFPDVRPGVPGGMIVVVLIGYLLVTCAGASSRSCCGYWWPRSLNRYVTDPAFWEEIDWPEVDGIQAEYVDYWDPQDVPWCAFEPWSRRVCTMYIRVEAPDPPGDEAAFVDAIEVVRQAYLKDATDPMPLAGSEYEIAILDDSVAEVWFDATEARLEIGGIIGSLLVDLILCGVAWLMSWLFVAHHRLGVRESRRQHRQCVHCGYDLSGHDHHCCPECGHENDPPKDPERHCSYCRYNLRGLGHDVCPECGARNGRFEPRYFDGPATGVKM